MERAILTSAKRDVKRLIRDGADVNEDFDGTFTPITLATTAGNLNMVKLLLDAGADPTLMTPNGGDCAIHVASRYNHTHIIKELIARGCSLEVPSDDGCRPLFIAAQNGCASAAKTLVEAGAQLEWKHEGAYTALYMACQCGHPDVVAELLNAGAYTGRQGRYGFTPLIQSSHRGYVEIVKMLLRHGCPPDVKNDQGCTALHLAASANQVKVMVELLDRGASPSVIGPEGYTAFDLASQNGHEEARLLLAQSDGGRQKTPPGGTPLHICMVANDYKGAARLLDEGAPPDETDGEGLTAFQRAVMHLEPKAVAVLLRGGANEKALYPQAYGLGLSPIGYTYMAEKTASEFMSPTNAAFNKSSVQLIRSVRDSILRASAFRGKSWMWPVGDGGEDEEMASFGGTCLAGKGGLELRGVPFRRAGQLRGRGVIVAKAMARYVQNT